MSAQTVVTYQQSLDVSGGGEIELTSQAGAGVFLLSIDLANIIDDTVVVETIVDKVDGSLAATEESFDTPYTGIDPWEQRWHTIGPVAFVSSGGGLLRFKVIVTDGTTSPLNVAWFLTKAAAGVEIIEEGTLNLDIDTTTFDIPTIDHAVGVYVLRLCVEPMRDGDTIHVWRTLTPNTGGGGESGVWESVALVDEQVGATLHDFGPFQSFDPSASGAGTLRQIVFHVRQTAGTARDIPYQVLRLTP